MRLTNAAMVEKGKNIIMEWSSDEKIANITRTVFDKRGSFTFEGEEKGMLSTQKIHNNYSIR